VWRGLSTSDWISAVGTVVSVVGFVIAIVQVRRVGRAVQRQQQLTAGAIIQSRTSDLERIELALREAKSRPTAQRAVLEWRRYASEALSFLDATGKDAPALTEALELSLGMIDIALEDLGDASVVLTDGKQQILREISRACAESRSLGVSMMLEDPS